MSEKLKVFHYDVEESHQTYNILYATNYLIKHGATGFVDEMRECQVLFDKYQLLKSIETYEQPQLQAQLEENL